MGTLAQLFETGEQTSQKGHFRNLVLIARFDGKVMDSEKKLLQAIAGRLSLTQEQVSEILDHPEQYQVIPPYSREERYERFIQLIEMALIDGVMTGEEEKLIKQLGVSLGFTTESISEKFKVIVEKVKSGVKRDQILAGFTLRKLSFKIEVHSSAGEWIFLYSIMISIDALAVEFNGSTLFSDVSFSINETDKIALMGKNGAGKSTLLKILAGVNKPTRGSISAPKEFVIAYLPQHLLTKDENTVFEETSKAFAGLFAMKEEIDQLNHELTVRTDYDSDDYYKIIERVSELSEKYYSIEETNFEADVEKVLLGLGFEREDFTRSTSEFSGGWRMRIELAKILLQKPDLILLDEPTNHMDIESIQWLEDFLINQAKAVVVISHDRAFVDNITNRTIEVTMGRIYDYKAKYSHYLELRKDRRAQQQKHFDEQQKMIAENQEFIERFKGTYSKTHQVQSRVKMLEKLVLVEVDEVDTSALRLKFPPAPRSGSYPVIAAEVGKSYGDHVVFKDASLTIERGQKVAFVGRNGEGKSTMIKAIMGEIEIEQGKIELGHNVQIGYFAQNQASMLDENLTIFDTIDMVAEGDVRTKIKDLLGAFMFSGDDITKKVKVLSGGEKTRLAMIKLLLQPVNLLILDEPTNHLDMKTKDIIKDALRDFDGTLILVSHDRDFLDGLATKVFEFGHKRVREHFEDIAGFLKLKKMENLREIEKK